MKIVDRKQPTNPSLSPTIWIGSPDSPVTVGSEAARKGSMRLRSALFDEGQSQLQVTEAACRKSA